MIYIKEKVIEVIKAIIKEHEKEGLGIIDYAATWKIESDLMTPLLWKHIGYVSALGIEFEVTREDLK